MGDYAGQWVNQNLGGKAEVALLTHQIQLTGKQRIEGCRRGPAVGRARRQGGRPARGRPVARYLPGLPVDAAGAPGHQRRHLHRRRGLRRRRAGLHGHASVGGNASRTCSSAASTAPGRLSRRSGRAVPFVPPARWTRSRSARPPSRPRPTRSRARPPPRSTSRTSSATVQTTGAQPEAARRARLATIDCSGRAGTPPFREPISPGGMNVLQAIRSRRSGGVPPSAAHARFAAPARRGPGRWAVGRADPAVPLLQLDHRQLLHAEQPARRARAGLGPRHGGGPRGHAACLGQPGPLGRLGGRAGRRDVRRVRQGLRLAAAAVLHRRARGRGAPGAR